MKRDEVLFWLEELEAKYRVRNDYISEQFTESLRHAITSICKERDYNTMRFVYIMYGMVLVFVLISKFMGG